MPANVAPPLKSTSTMLSCSGECVIARPSTRVRRNSDLPEPVAPMTRPCGPMPCWADSLMSRCTSEPPSPSPIGTRSRSRAGRGRQAGSGSKVCTSPSASSSMKSVGPAISPLDSTAPGHRVQRREPAGEGLGGRDRAGVGAGPDRLLAQSQRVDRVPAVGVGGAPRRRTGCAGGSGPRARPSGPAGRCRVTPCRPSGGTTWLPGGSSPPSITSSRCGVAGRSSAPNRGRSARSAGSSPARSASEVDTIRIGPTASDCRALWACGSHFTQSQCARFCSELSTATTRCSGAWKAVAEQISDRASERAGSSGPHTSTRSKARRSIEAGRSGWSRWTTSSRCSADAAAGSTWSIGVLSGGTSSSASGCAHTPYRTWRKPGSAGAVLPDPGALVGEGRQRGRVGVVPGERPALLVGGLAGDLADVGEVAQVLRARAGHLLRALLTLPVQLDDDEADGGEEEHAGGDQAAAAVGLAHRRDQHDRPEAAEHRDGVHEHAAGALVGLDLRRRLEHELPGRHLRRVHPRAAQRRRQRVPSCRPWPPWPSGPPRNYPAETRLTPPFAGGRWTT